MLILGGFITALLTIIVQADASAKALSLNLTSTWTAPMPNTIVSPASDYISAHWFAKSGFYGSDNINFTADPFTPSTAPVVQVNYPAGSYSPVGTKNDNTGLVGGAEFFSEMNRTQYNTALLSYDLAFDSSFDWVQGGKLPGIYGGEPSTGCSGGQKATGANCFSVRLMWREAGAGEAYAYIPTSSSLCSSKQANCNFDYGTSFSRGVIQFRTKEWTHLDIYVKLNTGTNTNGILQVWQDGSLTINQQHLQFRSDDSVGVSSMMFSTFFGGGSPDYATPITTSTYFKNMQFSVGNTPDPTQGNAATSLTATSWMTVSLMFASLLYCYLI